MGPGESLAAPKRKFYRLLENLSRSNVDKSNTDSTDAVNNKDEEPSSKRSKVLEEERTANAAEESRPLSMASATSTIAPSMSADAGYERPSVRILATAFEARKKQQNEQSLFQPTPLEKLPAYSPSSQEQFLQRLKTFSDIWIWTPKPRVIGEVAWARVGWSALNDGKARDTVFCLACREQVVVRLTRDPDTDEKEGKKSSSAERDGEMNNWWDDDPEKDLLAKYKGLIKNGHAQDCLWRKFYCSSDIYQIDMTDPTKWQSTLRERYFSLATMEDVLPDNVVFPEYEGDDERKIFELEKLIKNMPEEVLQLQQKQHKQTEKENAPPGSETTTQNGDREETLTTETSKRPSESPPVNRTAFALAICGWHGQSTSGVNLAYCKYCFQRCGLWLYKASESSNKSTTSLHEPSEPMSFNPVDLHREHCPWKNVKSQSERAHFKGLAAWQVQVELLKRWLPPKKIKTPQEIESEVDMETNATDEPLIVQTWQEAEEEERQLESKLRKLKRMFTIKKADKRLTKKRSRADIQSRGTTASRPGTGAGLEKSGQVTKG